MAVREIHATQEYESAIRVRGKHVYVKFGASWCGPCKEFAPIYHKAAGKDKNALFYEVEIDRDESSESLATDMGITSLPTVKGFFNGEEIGAWVGSQAFNKFK